MLKSLAGFSEKLRVVEAVRESGLAARTARTNRQFIGNRRLYRASTGWKPCAAKAGGPPH